MQDAVRLVSHLAQNSTEPLIDSAITRTDWITAAAILLGGLVLSIVFSGLLRRVLVRGIGEGFASIIMSRLAGYAVFLISLFYSLSTLGVRVGPLLGALGLGGLVLALALQGVVENFVGSIILQTRRPFTIGDTVELDGRIGTVADIDARTTLLHSLDGPRIRIPNARVVESTIVNLTIEPHRRSHLDVGVAYDSDLERVFEILGETFERVARVRKKPAPIVTVTGFGESSIGFSLLYWHKSDVPSELATRSDLTIAVHQALHAADIAIAFPQVVVWSGAAGAGPYGEPPRTVATHYPALEGSNRRDRKRIAPKLRRPGRKEATD